MIRKDNTNAAGYSSQRGNPEKTPDILNKSRKIILKGNVKKR